MIICSDEKKNKTNTEVVNISYVKSLRVTHCQMYICNFCSCLEKHLQNRLCHEAKHKTRCLTHYPYS